VKYGFLIVFGFFYAVGCAAQDTLAQRERLSDSVVAHYHILSTAPNVKIGQYTVFFKHRTLLVRGNYTNGKKTGVWQFFDIRGRLNQKYNYDKKIFTYEAPLYSSGDFSFLFDDSLKVGDRLTRPLKIGGIYYGFLPYLNIYKLPFDTDEFNTYFFGAYIELLISPMGRLADFNIRVASSDYQYDQTINLDVNLLSEEDRTFTPATKNGIPVISRILIRCFVTEKGGLDFY
jgi:hypothetical protein